MATEFVRGDDLSRLTVPLDGEGWEDVDLAGAWVRLEAASRDITEPLFATGAVDASARTATFVGLGALLSAEALAPKRAAKYVARAHLTTAAGPQGFGLPFEFTITENPLEGVNDTSMGSAHPFEFPHPISEGLMLAPSPTIKLNLAADQRQVIFERAPGQSGLIRNLGWIITSFQLGSAIPPSAILEIYYDGETSPSVSIPLGNLAALEHGDSSYLDMQISTPAFELQAGPRWSAYPNDFVGVSGNFRLPIPYTNGIKIAILGPPGTNTHDIYTNVIAQEPLPASWNNNLRLLAVRSNEVIGTTLVAGNVQITNAETVQRVSGTFPAGLTAGKVIIASDICAQDMLVLERLSDTQLRVSPLDTVNATLNTTAAAEYAGVHTFLNRPAGESGWIAMIVGAAKCAAGQLTMLFEGNPRIWIGQDDELPALEWTSVEDFANGCYYFEQSSRGEEGGVTALSETNLEWCVYKVFYRWPIRYRDGVRATVPQYVAANTTFNWTTFFYKQMP